MKKFSFKLDHVMQARKAKEDEALSVLADRQRKYQAEIARREELRETLSQSLLRREKLGSSPTEISEFQMEQAFIQGTKQRMIQADQVIFRASREVEKALRNYLVMKKRAMAIETLRDRAFQDYKKERAKNEQRNLDDLVLMRSRLSEELK